MRAFVAVVLVSAVAIGCRDHERSEAPLGPQTITVPIVVHEGSVAQQSFFVAKPRGVHEVPPNNSPGRGEAIFELNEAGTELRYRLFVSRIENVLQAHIHNAPVGVNGGIVVWLYPDAPPPVLIPGLSRGLLAEGIIRDAQVVGNLAAEGLAGLVREMRAGNTYVNVHTTWFPPGEIRDQIH